MKGKAVVFEDRMKVVFREVEIPEPGDEELVVDVEYSWISIGTESSFLRGERINGETFRSGDDPWPFPMVMGYQKTGIVRQAGNRVRGLSPGDRVFIATSKVSNMFFPQGGHVSPAVVASSQAWKLPEDAVDIDYSGLVLTQVGYNCGSRPPVAAGSRAVVIGDGLVGQWAAQTLQHRGAEVLVIGRHDERLRYLPAGIVSVNARQASAAERIAADWGQTDIIVDSVGDMETVDSLWPMMSRGSHLVSAGFLGERGKIDIQRLRLKETTLHAPSGWQKERMDRTLEGIRDGWLQTGALITHRFAAEDAAAAWQAITERKQAMLGVVLEWSPHHKEGLT